MNAHLSLPSALIGNTFGGRVFLAMAEATRAAVDAFQCAWREQAVQYDRARSYELMEDINARTLQDIGAPDWLVQRSIERKDAHRLYLLGLYQS